MANGDDAAAAGMDVVPGTASVRQGYDEDNKTRDYIAQRTNAVQPIAKGGTGSTTAADARSALGVPSTTELTTGLAGKSPAGHTHNVSELGAGTVNGDLGATGKLSAQGNIEHNGQIYSPGTRNRTVSTNYASVYSGDGGWMGIPPSSRRFKTEIQPWQEDAARILGIMPVTYRLKSDVAELGDAAPVRVGFIAEDLIDAGLEEFVPTNIDPDSDDFGLPISINYEFYVVALQLVVRHQSEQMQDIHTRLAAAGIA
ncbi:hypothetical protein ASE14_08155 [Agromyces sp. Root81]|uniref:tail fiber domain-containing protein n=1 Tax=Agromyces sp. Root81 TaxID=1736601 RepID=UPI0006F34AF0|nr:tail fiber domain-containing protein [Agromyces sp. Root81]KRC60923.1 hypothetical protein ASE14_08155 [Agromyces sp. Root81]